MRLSRVDQHIKNEPCAKHSERYSALSPAVTQAFLEVSDLWRQFRVFIFSVDLLLCILNLATKFSTRVRYVGAKLLFSFCGLDLQVFSGIRTCFYCF
jgi:hypothetical protein